MTLCLITSQRLAKFLSYKKLSTPLYGATAKIVTGAIIIRAVPGDKEDPRYSLLPAFTK